MVVLRMPPLDVTVKATRVAVQDWNDGDQSRLPLLVEMSSTTFGRCALGLAGFFDVCQASMKRFLALMEPTASEVDDMITLLKLLASASRDEDNASLVARMGMHMPLLMLMEHEDADIQEAAAAVVGNCTSDKYNSVGFSFPHRTRQLGDIKRAYPLCIPLPIDPRDKAISSDAISVLVRQVPIRMTGQPKTGYLLWGASIVMARWIHLHRSEFAGKSTLEVGSGLGLSGIVAARYAATTTLTDYQEDTCRALAYNVELNRPFTHQIDCSESKPNVDVLGLDWDSDASINTLGSKFDVIIASDIICEPSTAEGFLRVVHSRLSETGVAYLMNADSHSRFGVLHLHDILAKSDLDYKITSVKDLPDGDQLLDTVSDAQELSYEHYEIRLPKSAC